jgi:hypothetical protein
LIIFLASLIASACLYFLYNRPDWSQSAVTWPYVSGCILGGAAVYFLLGMLFGAWFKGTRGAVIGTLVVAGASFLAGFGEYKEHEPDRGFEGAIQKHVDDMRGSLKTQLNQFGGARLDPSIMESMLQEMKDKSKELDPQERAAVEGLSAVMNRLMVPVREARPIGEEIFSKSFEDPASMQSVDEIDYRLGKLESYKTYCLQLLGMYPDLDLMLKTELAQRGLSATQIKDYADPFIKSAHLEIAVPLAESNVEIANLMIQRLNLLKSEFGHWSTQNNVVYFEDHAALEQWNNDLRRIFGVAERREALTRQMAANQSN